MTFLLTIALALIDLTAAPRLYHVERFAAYPSNINEMLAFNRSYYMHVNKGREVDPDSYLIPAIEKECDKLYFAWAALRDARIETYSVNTRRQNLGVLLKIIGPEMFMRGEMPPCVPLWRFTGVRVL